MTVEELIRELESMPQNVPVYAEGELADKVVMENCQGDICVRIFKAWDIEFVGRGIEPQESDNCRCSNCKYFGEILKDNIHSCNNNKSIFKACLETATGCEKFEPQESEVDG